MAIEIQEVKTKSELKKFIWFGINTYYQNKFSLYVKLNSRYLFFKWEFYLFCLFEPKPHDFIIMMFEKIVNLKIYQK